MVCENNKNEYANILLFLYETIRGQIITKSVDEFK